MIPTRFRYVAPDDVSGCVTELSAGRARLLAGGTWVVPEMSRGESAPEVVVDLRNAGLRGVRGEPGGVLVGAMTTYSDLLADRSIAVHAPMLRQLATGITGGRALHTQATVGGSAMAGRPQADVPGAFVALGAVAHVVGPRGARSIPAADLLDPAGADRATAGEVVTGFSVPTTAGRVHGYVKIKRGTSSWPIATAAALVSLDDAGRVLDARVTLGAVSRTPVVVELSDLLAGSRLEDAALFEAGRRASGAVSEPWEDELAPARYRAAVAGPAAVRALRQARTRVEEEDRHE